MKYYFYLDKPNQWLKKTSLCTDLATHDYGADLGKKNGSVSPSCHSC